MEHGTLSSYTFCYRKKKKKNVVKYKVLFITWKWKTIKKCFCAIYLLTIRLTLCLVRAVELGNGKVNAIIPYFVQRKIHIIYGTRWFVCKLLKSSSFPFTFFVIIFRVFERVPKNCYRSMNETFSQIQRSLTHWTFCLMFIWVCCHRKNDTTHNSMDDKIESVKCNFDMWFLECRILYKCVKVWSMNTEHIFKLC